MFNGIKHKTAGLSALYPEENFGPAVVSM